MLILKMVWGMEWGHVDDDSDNCFGGNLRTALLGKGIGNKSLRFGWG